MRIDASEIEHTPERLGMGHGESRAGHVYDEEGGRQGECVVCLWTMQESASGL